MCAGLTWSVGLQVPGPPVASGLDGGGQRGVNGTTGLHVPFLVPRCGDLQDGDGGTLVQLPSGRQHFREALLAHANASLQGAAQIHISFELKGRHRAQRDAEQGNLGVNHFMRRAVGVVASTSPSR